MSASIVHAGSVDAPAIRRGPLTADLPDALARILVAGLFCPFVLRFAANFAQTGRFTSLLLLCSESLIVVLTIVRRSAVAVDRAWRTRTVTTVSIVGPFLLRPGDGGLPDLYTSPMLAVGLAVVIAGKVTLGRSFGIMPANRGIVCAGLYRIVRHPIYAGYLVTHLAFLAANPLAVNALLLVTADTALVVRAVREEETLLADARYGDYCARVRWRLMPGVF